MFDSFMILPALGVIWLLDQWLQARGYPRVGYVIPIMLVTLWINWRSYRRLKKQFPGMSLERPFLPLILESLILLVSFSAVFAVMVPSMILLDRRFAFSDPILAFLMVLAIAVTFAMAFGCMAGVMHLLRKHASKFFNAPPAKGTNP